jgi:hypothetical protein
MYTGLTPFSFMEGASPCSVGITCAATTAPGGPEACYR